MDIAFSEEIGYFIMIYLDDIIVYSKTDEEHLIHLRKVFEKIQKIWTVLESKENIVWSPRR